MVIINVLRCALWIICKRERFSITIRDRELSSFASLSHVNYWHFFFWPLTSAQGDSKGRFIYKVNLNFLILTFENVLKTLISLHKFQIEVHKIFFWKKICIQNLFFVQILSWKKVWFWLKIATIKLKLAFALENVWINLFLIIILCLDNLISN